MSQLQFVIVDTNPISHIRKPHQIPKQFLLCITILSFCLLQFSFAQQTNTDNNINKDTRQSVFAPYIAAHIQWQSKKETSVTGRTVADPIGDIIDSETGMSESTIRGEMLSKSMLPKSSSEGNVQKKSRQKPYAQGHTFIPTVNVKKTNDSRQHDLSHTSTEQIPEDKTNVTDTSRSSSTSVQETTTENLTTIKTDGSQTFGNTEELHDSNTIKTAGAVDAMSKLEQKEKTSRRKEQVQSEHVEVIQQGTLQGSFVVPLFAIGAIGWLVSVIMKKTGIYTQQSRRKTRLVRKKLASPRMVA